jgi:hypothetical protein
LIISRSIMSVLTPSKLIRFVDSNFRVCLNFVQNLFQRTDNQRRQ